jgi:hypothetical protein
MEVVLDELIQTKEEWNQFDRADFNRTRGTADRIQGVSRMTKQKEMTQ